MTIDQNALEKLFKLITKYQITELEIDGIKIKKNLHLGKALKPTQSLAPQTHFSIPEDDIMFASSFLCHYKNSMAAMSPSYLLLLSCR